MQAALSQQAIGTSLVAIVGSHIFNPKDDPFHVFAIQNFKEKDVNHLYIYDSRGGYQSKKVHQNEKLIHQAFGLKTYLGYKDLKIYYPKDSRQNHDDFQGFSYAIQDARLLMAPPQRPPNRTETNEFILPKELDYNVHALHVKFFKELIELDLKAYKGLPKKPVEKDFSFLPQLSIGLVIGLLSMLAYRLFQTTEIQEVTQNQLLPY